MHSWSVGASPAHPARFVVQYAMPAQRSRRLRTVFQFALRSLPRAYGRAFLWHMALRHPLRTARGFRAYWRMPESSSTEQRALSAARETAWLDHAVKDGERLLVATGFCQKPMRAANDTPDCPAGRFNHDCPYLADLDLEAPAPLHPACAICPIRTLGHAALQAGASFAILTSALDIAHDVLIPSLEEGRFTHVLFAICPYSLEPMSLAQLIGGPDG